MESSYACEGRDEKEPIDHVLRVRRIDLGKSKEELRHAKYDLEQSWLATRPLIDKLERVKSDFVATKSQTLMSNSIMSELEIELENTENSTKLKTEMELELILKANELNQSLDRIREEMEDLGIENDKRRRSRTELKQTLRLKRQNLKTLQLTLRAIRLESEAIGASVTEAVKHINSSETDTNTVDLSHEEYNLLTKRAKEETLLADWRISVSVEHRLVAEESRDSALRRLEEILKVKQSKKENNEQKGEYFYATTDEEEEKSRLIAEFEETGEEVAYKTPPKLILWSSKESSLQVSRRIPVINKRLSRSKRWVQIKKPSLLVRIRMCFIQKVATWFC